MKNIIFILTLIVSSLSINTYASEADIDSLNQQLYKGSNRYVENNITYRVVKWNVLQAYFEDIKSIDQDKSQQITDARREISSMKQINATQATKYEELSAKYEQAVRANDAMAFFSLLIPKKQYNFIMWSLVLALIACVLVLFFMFKRSHQVTRNAQKERDESREEYEAYRQRTLRREQEVANSYLREINKLKSQMGM